VISANHGRYQPQISYYITNVDIKSHTSPQVSHGWPSWQSFCVICAMACSMPNFYFLWWPKECWRSWIIVCRRVKCCVCFLNVWRVMLITMACSLPNFYLLRWFQDCWRCWMIVGECNVAFFLMFGELSLWWVSCFDKKRLYDVFGGNTCRRYYSFWCNYRAPTSMTS
jgi:hypothetical protein